MVSHPHISVKLLSPEHGSCIKRRRGESIKIDVGVISSASLDASLLIVEVWTPTQHITGEVHAAIKLSFIEMRGETAVFSGLVPLPHTGEFILSFRARLHEMKYWEWAEQNDEQAFVQVWVDPEWIYDSIVYNAFVRYFGASEDTSDSIRSIKPGTFSDIQDHMKRLKSMGVNVLYLNPVHMIGELYRNYNPHDLLPEYLQPGCPYSIKDYKSIDPELSFGTAEGITDDHPFSEFRKFVDAAHKIGIRVFMDLVFNHSAHDSVFQRLHPEWYLYKENITSLEDPYLYPDDIRNGKPWGDPKHTFSPYDHGYWWRDAAQLNWNNISSYPEFIQPHTAPNEPPKNPTIKQMRTYFKSVVKFWIKEFGIDGFRCDVAYRVPVDFWHECINEARIVAKQSHPANGSVDGDVVFIAEDYHVAIADLLKAGFTAAYGDFSNKLYDVPSLFGYLEYMYSKEHFPEGSMWFIFPECHDFHRNPTKIANDYRSEHRDADLNANKSRWTLTATLPGIPMIFNGFEKIEWQPASLFSYSMVDWESDKDISDHIKKVNIARRKLVSLQRGNYYFLHTSHGISDDAKLFAFARVYDGNCVLVVVNLDIVSSTQGIVYLSNDLPFCVDDEYVLFDHLSGKEYKRSGNELFIELPAGEAHIFEVK